MKFEAQHYPYKLARRQFRFTVGFSCVLLLALILIDVQAWGLPPKALIVVCAIPPLALGIGFTFWFSRIREPQRWRIDEGFAEYSSPSKHPGDSFRYPISEIEKIDADGDGDFATCVLKDGRGRYKFDIRTKEGRVFLKHLQDRVEN